MGEEGVELFYRGELPGWKIVVPQPERFRGVDYDIRFRLFKMPQGTLIAYWLRLFDVPDQPYFVHRVLNLADENVIEYMQKLIETRRMALVFENNGDGSSFTQEISVAKADLEPLLSSGSSHVRDLGEVEEEAALEDFMEVFNHALREFKDVGKAWTAVSKKFPAP